LVRVNVLDFVLDLECEQKFSVMDADTDPEPDPDPELDIDTDPDPEPDVLVETD
jgi:hypothetical protein